MEALRVDWKSAYRREEQASWEDIAEAVRESVTMGEAVSYYLPGITPRHRRIPCPLHNGKDYNFSFGSTGYKCFVCGETGDVIEFVRLMCSLRTRTDAIRQMNHDFCLNLPIGREVTVQENTELQKRRQKAREREEREQALQNTYDAAMDEYVRLDRIILDMRRKPPAERNLTPEYIEACKHIDGAWDAAESARTALYAFSHESDGNEEGR